MINTIGSLRKMTKRLQELGAKPELEMLDLGYLMIVNDPIKGGLVHDLLLIQLCMGWATSRRTIC
ncbi:hypothetical protein CWO91_25300 [Bradyrhizobium genosp. SA-3]|uniref:3-keto-5-aminohexanoate cleavage protein n=1 Tax=Bradyrhizobium genosp. SA-3 TaxID=508868 RepID=UPI001028F9D0|nr:3-keto-5-aminohexanoate cleavage protein [Bradyrhizobium genosp. SA-3]RZN07887.1 hypothetical protein CWO91_25300 [Bradyrhizobium genosp. SA-3]